MLRRQDRLYNGGTRDGGWKRMRDGEELKRRNAGQEMEAPETRTEVYA
jgi:hypothetical protein